METALSAKLKLIDDNIELLDKGIENGNLKKLGTLIFQIVLIYFGEIRGIDSGLSSLDSNMVLAKRPIDYESDAQLLKAKLRKYKIELLSNYEDTAEKCAKRKEFSVSSFYTNDSASSHIPLSLDDVLIAINDLPTSVISEVNKEILYAKLVSFSVKKHEDKAPRWEKAKELLKCLINMPVDVANIVLPYIVEIIE